MTPLSKCIVSGTEEVRIINETVGEGRESGKLNRSLATVVVVPSQSMDPFKNRYVTFVQKILLFIGFWHTLSYKERILRSSVPFSMFLYFILVQVCPFITLDFDLQSFVSKLQVFIPTISMAAMYCTGIVHFETVQTIFSYIVEDWKRLQNDGELKIMQKHAYESQLFSKIFAFTCGLFISFFIVLPILYKLLTTKELTSNFDRFPMTSCLDYFIDQEKYKYAKLIFHMIISILIVVIAIMCYSIYFWFLQHTCARLSIIKNEIHRPFQNNQRDFTVDVKPTDLSDWIIDIIKHFSRTREYMNMVNVVGEGNYMVQMMLSFVIIIIECICLFQMPVLLQLDEDIKDCTMSIIIMLGILFVIYINNYIGQKLIDHSTDVYREACLVPIHEVPLKTQKLLLTMLVMNKKPCAISIGKVFVSSHEFFANLLRASLSFAMFLHSMQKT